MALDKDDAKLIAEALNKMTSKGSTGAPDARVGSLFDLMKSPTTAFTGAVEKGKEGLENLGKAYERIEKEMSAGMGTWRKLSDSGVTFGNDVIKMGAAAAGTRMDLGEFADMVGKNSTFLAGFGGSINKGAEEFARTSKVMYDQYGETTDRLRQMGLTNKDLNETLALQAGMIGNSMRSGKERDKIAIESATALATEMDLTAKLTGKSRQEQMEGAKKLQADASFQAKVEQATRNMGETEAAAYRTKISGEYAKAEAIGLGQSFKETFVYGQVMSKQAADEQVMAGRAGAEISKAATAAAAGNFKEAAERNAAAMSESAKNNKDASFQNMAILNGFGGTAGETTARLFMTNKAIADNIELLKKDPENKNKTDAELLMMAKDKAKAEQNASDGATKAMVNAEQRFKDAGRVIQNSLVLPIQKDLNPALNKLADTVLNARSAFIPGAREKGNVAATEGELLEGRRRYEQKEPIRGASGVAAVGYQIAAVTNPVGKVAEKTVDVGVKGAEKLGDALTPATKKSEPLPRSGGTYGAGKMFEDVGAILEITKPGEVVLNGEQQMNLAKGMMDKGAATAFSNLSKNLDFSKITAGMPSKIDMPKIEMPKIEMPKIDVPKTEMPKIEMPKIEMPKIDQSKLSMQSLGLDFSKLEMPKMPSLDLNKVFQDIKTTVSGGGANTVKGPDIAELAKPFNKSFDEFGANFDEVVTKMSKEIGTAIPTDMFDEFGANFDEVVARMSNDLQQSMPLDSINQTADALEFANKRRQELEDIMNDGIARSGAEWDEIFDEAEQLDGQIEKLTNKQLDAFSKYADGWDESSDIMDRVVADISEAIPIDEFGDLEGAIAKQKYMDMGEFAGVDEAIAKQKYMDMGEFAGVDEAIAKQKYMDGDRIDVQEAKQIPNRSADALNTVAKDASPTASQGRGITMDSFTLGANGLPIAKPKAIAAAVPDKKSEKSEAEKAEEAREKVKAEAAKQGIDASKLKEQEGASKSKSEKSATLDDLLKSMNSLNMLMGQLIEISDSGHRSTAKAAKSGSNNVYAR